MDVLAFKKLSFDEQISWTIQRGRGGDYTGLKLLSEIYDPRVNYNTERFATALKDNGLLSLLLTAVQNFTVECLLLLRHFARQEGSEEQISELGGVKILCEVMKKNMEKVNIIESCCILLGLLATNEEIRKSLTEEGTVRLLVDLLNNYIHNPRIVVFICRALNNACYKLTENKIIFVEGGGYGKLVSLITSDFDVKTKLSVALLLRNVCNLDEDRTFLLDTVHTAIEDLIKIIQSDSVDIQTHLLWATLNLTINSGSIKRQFGEKGGISKVLEIMQQHSANLNIQTLICTLLLQLSRKQYNRIAIGKAGGVAEIIGAIHKHRQNEDLLHVSLNLLDLLCSQGINRKRITKEKGLLDEIMNTLKENLSNQNVVVLILNVVHKIACGASQSKYELRAANALPMFTEVITSYTTNPEIRNLANNCISDIFKPSPLEEEDSNESFSSDSSDSDEDEIINETPAQKETEIRIPTPRIESNKPTYIDKHPSVAENYRAIDPLNIKDDLMHERSARKKLEEEVIHLKKKLKESEARFEDHLETLNQNQQLSADLEVSQRSVKDLKLKVQTCQQEIESDRSKFDIDLKEREKNLCQDISNLKESMEEKDRIIEKLKQEKIENNLDKQNLVEDVLLFEWMIVAIRMDLTMHRQNITTTFDKSSFYEKLKREKIPHSEWPKRISTEMSIKNTNTSRSKLITKNDPQVKYNK